VDSIRSNGFEKTLEPADDDLRRGDLLFTLAINRGRPLIVKDEVMDERCEDSN